jgi:CheY-like chemotaxis protein
MERTFGQLASEKGLAFDVDFSEELPESILTDEKRLQQVVLNLLSNAFKFTAAGGVTLQVKPASSGWSANHPVLHDGQQAIEISVSDTGIGIPQDKQKLIFEAFQQADGTTSRKYGGTGLGLSISREIARLLGGELQVRSQSGEGSTFTLYVPLQSAGRRIALPGAEGGASLAIAPVSSPIAVPDDRADLDDKPFVLIVEDDPTFAGILLELAHEAGLKGVISSSGSGTVAMVRKMKPNAITLDLGLSDIDGFVLLDLLGHDPETQHIPVHVISGAEQAAHALTIGAAGVTEKPAEGEVLAKLFEDIAETARLPRKKGKARPATPSTGSKAMAELSGARILVVDDDVRNIYSLTSVLEAHDVLVLHAESGAEGIRILETAPHIDAALVDIMMPEMDGYETMRRIRANSSIADIPLIAVTAKAMKGDRQKCLDAGASDYISKPVDIDILLALIRVWLGRSKSKREPARAKRAAKVA